MKKLFFMPFLAAALFSCSEKGLVSGGDDVTDGGSEISYLSVRIVSGQEAGTRAVEEDSNFRVGSKEENQVNSIRFYFFGKDGKAVAVKNGKDTYYDATADEITNDYDDENAGKGQNIESTVSAIIAIESPKGDEKPYYVAAVVNPTAAAPVLVKDQDRVDKLQDAVADFSTTNGFVMSSSVYKAKKHAYSGGENDNEWKEGEGDMEYIMVPVYDKIQPTRLEAEKTPATLYVERVLAKVSASVSMVSPKQGQDGSTLYEVGIVDKGNASKEVNDGAKIYVKFLGWNVTGTRKESRLVKKINITWPSPFDAGWGSLSWNDADNHRSYWAINPNDDQSKNPINDYYNFGDFDEAHALPFVPSSGKYNYTYLQENAGKYDSGTEKDIMTSKIIVAAQLVDENEKPLELVKWGGNVYAMSDKLMDALAGATQLYVVTESGGAKTYDPLRGDDIKFSKAAADSPRYCVSIALNSPGKKYAVKEGPSSYKEIAEEPLEKALASVGKIKYWNTGYTYYWVDIKHLGGDVTGDSLEKKIDGIGKYGVVRNHWYDYTFTSVQGLGVPVPNPGEGETIYPETPSEEDLFYLAAEIKILSWRMVQHNNEGLGW